MKRLLSNDFIRHNAIFFIGSLAVSALNYAYYPVLGRLLSTSDFGEVQALVSLFLQAAIFLNVVSSVAVNIVSNEPNEAVRSRIIYELERFALVVALGGLSLVLIFAPQIQAFLQFEQVAPFFMLALVLLVSVPGALRNAYMRGRSAFGQLSITGIIGSLAKIIFSAVFVLLGFRTLGAIGGLVAAQTISLMYAIFQSRRLGLTAPAGLKLWRRPDLTLIRPHLPYALLVLTVSLVTTTLYSFDIVVVKHYFGAQEAGEYAGIATIARIIFFLTGSIAAVLLSSIKLEAPPQANRRLLLRSAALQTAIGGSVLALFAIAPNFFIQLLLGEKYLGYAFLLPKLSLALFILAMANLLFNYDLALRRRSAAVVAIIGSCIMIFFVGTHHASLSAVVDSLLWGSAALLTIRGLDSLRRHI